MEVRKERRRDEGERRRGRKIMKGWRDGGRESFQGKEKEEGGRQRGGGGEEIWREEGRKRKAEEVRKMMRGRDRKWNR